MKLNKGFLLLFLGLVYMRVAIINVFANDCGMQLKKGNVLQKSFDVDVALKNNVLNSGREKSVDNEENLKESKYVAFQFDFKNVIDEKNVVYFIFTQYITVKKILVYAGLWNEKVKEDVLNVITTGDADNLKLVVLQEMPIYFNDGRDAYKLKDVLLKINFDEVKIISDDFNTALEEFNCYYKNSIKKLSDRFKRIQFVLQQGDGALLDEDIKVSEEAVARIEESIKEATNEKERKMREYDKAFFLKYIEEAKHFIREVNKNEKSDEYKEKLKNLTEPSKKWIKKMEPYIRFLVEKSIEIENLNYYKFKEANIFFEVRKELKNLRTGGIF